MTAGTEFPFPAEQPSWNWNYRSLMVTPAGKGSLL